jgi:hypothetical protein
MDNTKIEEAARRLQIEIWRRRKTLWNGLDVHPLEALDPQMAALVLGVTFEYASSIKFTVERSGYETAGLLNRKSKTIVVATRFGDQIARFTAGHELGHWDLHPRQVQLHRDIPVTGLERKVRDPIEREADHFSACFLMPAKLVRKVFQDMFQTDGKPFAFNEAALYNLRTNEVDELLYPDIDSYQRELTLARARSFGSRNYQKSMAELFQVSAATMAIRIRELELVRAWP